MHKDSYMISHKKSYVNIKIIICKPCISASYFLHFPCSTENKHLFFKGEKFHSPLGLSSMHFHFILCVNDGKGNWHELDLSSITIIVIYYLCVFCNLVVLFLSPLPLMLFLSSSLHHIHAITYAFDSIAIKEISIN